MTQIFATDENNDTFVGSDGHLAIVTDLSAVLQECEHVAKIVRGELIFNTLRGVLGFENNDDVFSNAPNLLQFEFRLRGLWRAIPEVTEVKDFSAQLVNNVIKYDATIVTIFGEAPISKEIS